MENIKLNKPNIALITPYTSLSSKISQYAQGRFECHIYHGYLDEAAHIAATLNSDFYDVIISRGGTAEYIKQATAIPVVTIQTTPMDLLEALLPHRLNVKKVAFFNYRHYLNNISNIALAFNIQIDEYVFNSSLEIREIMSDLVAEDYDLVIGGSPVIKIASELELDSALIENGSESINNALNEVKAIIETKRRQDSYRARLEMILSSITEGIIVTDTNNKILIFNKSAENIVNIAATEVIGKPVDLIMKNTRINQVLLSKSPEIRELQDIGNTSIITSRVPIFIGDECIGVVCSFTDAPQIQKAEQIIRGRLIRKGFIAKHRFSQIMTGDEKFKKTIELAKTYAETDATIMLYGESGTGKELFAQSIHSASTRKSGPFVAINCAAIPEPLLESELFGYEGGAFTGAKKEGKEGLIELAHNGTLFLDEIGELPLPLQSRLLRVLQEHEIMRIGGKNIIPVNIRVIGATHKNLYQMCLAHQFRTDLFYRLNILTLAIPPLRERSNDLIYLAKIFLNNTTEEYRLDSFSKLFANYSWPGNVRELRALIERLAIVSEKFPTLSWREVLTLTGFNFINIDNANLPSSTLQIDLADFASLKEVVQKTEKEIIVHLLDVYQGNQQMVIEKLKISRMSLWRKLNYAQ